MCETKTAASRAKPSTENFCLLIYQVSDRPRQRVPRRRLCTHSGWYFKLHFQGEAASAVRTKAVESCFRGRLAERDAQTRRSHSLNLKSNWTRAGVGTVHTAYTHPRAIRDSSGIGWRQIASRAPALVRHALRRPHESDVTIENSARGTKLRFTIFDKI